MCRAKLVKDTKEEIEGIGFGTLFRLEIYRKHGGGKGSLGVVLAIDSGRKWDGFSRPLIVAFEGCPLGRYRLSPKEIQVIDAGMMVKGINRG